MDGKIYTLLTIYIVYFLTAVSMALFPGVQKVLTGLIFGGMGIVLFLISFLVWVLNPKNEG
jgi:flagellar biogenesis protein FliO